MAQKPIKREAKILDKEMKVLIFIIGIFSDLILFALLFWLDINILDIDYIRTIMFAALGIDSLLYVFSCRSLSQPIWRMNLFSNKYLLLAVSGGFILLLLPIYLPGLRSLFNLVILGWHEWLLVVTLGLLDIVLIETTKHLFYPKYKKLKAFH